MITRLNVPFNEKEAAKALGAKFDMGLKVWYVPDGVDLIPFLQWLENAPNLSKKVKKTIRRKV